jgi:hypothetical protein
MGSVMVKEEKLLWLRGGGILPSKAFGRISMTWPFVILRISQEDIALLVPYRFARVIGGLTEDSKEDLVCWRANWSEIDYVLTAKHGICVITKHGKRGGCSFVWQWFFGSSSRKMSTITDALNAQNIEVKKVFTIFGRTSHI